MAEKILNRILKKNCLKFNSYTGIIFSFFALPLCFLFSMGLFNNKFLINYLSIYYGLKY